MQVRVSILYSMAAKILPSNGCSLIALQVDQSGTLHSSE